VIGWTVPADVFLLVIMSWVITFYVGHSLKDYFQLPRPFVIDKDVVCLESHFSDEYGLPSTHCQAVWAIPTTLLTLLELQYLGWWIAFALVYALSVSFSRLYLGVHSLLDCIVGILLGLATCGLVNWIGPLMMDYFMSLSPISSVIYVLVIHILMLKCYPKIEGYSTTYR
jgi:membrane-associated phospholipid phosphatase